MITTARATIGATLVGLVVACAEPRTTTAERADAEAAVRAPGLAGVVDLAGVPVDPLAAGAPAVVLVFVSTHCPIANRYAPTLRALGQAWQAQGVRAWLVYPDPDDDPAAIATHQAEYGLSWPTVRDPEHALVARAGVRVTPEAAVWVPGGEAPAYRGRIDDRAVELGKVRARASTHELRDAVEAVLAGRRPAPAEGPAIGCYISDLR